MTITLKPLTENDIKHCWQIGYREDLPEWKKWDGPYFDDYQPFATFEAFQQSGVYTFFQQPFVQGIFVGEEPIGIVTRHWENEATRWLEVGIVIFDPAYWNGGYGTAALKQWIAQIFQEIAELEHIGLTTWSGNHRMMKAAEKIGMLQEAKIRKVRYWQGVYYDSVKYGILREEWKKA